MSLKLILFVVILISVTHVDSEECDRFNEFKVKIVNEKHAEFFKELQAKAIDLKVLIDRPAKQYDSECVFRVPLCKEKEVKELLKKFEVEKYVETPLIVSSRRSLKNENKEEKSEVQISDVTERYLSSKEIDTFLDKISEAIKSTSTKINVNIKEEGNSYEKRPIKSITIGFKNKANPTVVIDAGVHAREWHARSLGLYCISQLLEEAKKEENGMLYNITFIIIPNVNPDGYEFSQTVDNMWRKNRRPITPECVGVDINRNYDAHWELGDREKIPCEEVYKGTEAFSEPESSVIKNILTSVNSSCFLYISIHTYGNSILFPNGWTVNKHERFDQLMDIAKAGAKVVEQKFHSKFIADQSGSGLYVAAGGSDDWAIDKLDIPYCFTFEIGAEELGFQVPKSGIKKAVEEGWEAIRAMVYKALSFKSSDVKFEDFYGLKN